MQYKLLLVWLLVFPALIIRDNIFLSGTVTAIQKPDIDLSGITRHQKATTGFWERGKAPVTDTDTAALKQSDWYAAVTKGIEQEEYMIRYNAGNKAYSSPNIAQHLRAIYFSNKVILKPRTGNEDKWRLCLQVKGIYAGWEKIFSPSVSPAIVHQGNELRFNSDGAFVTEYINDKEGVRQNFIINHKPAGDPQRISVLLEANNGWHIDLTGKKEIHFEKAALHGYANKLTYNKLKAWDADHRELACFFSISKNRISINVNAADAVYPITIDPLSSSPATILNGTSSNDYFGVSVASAGDVNGDGYSDVIVGAYGVSSNTGKAYLFKGSSTGLSTSPAVTLNGISTGDRFGYCVAGAGDVNGDGYSDVIVGAYGVSSSKGAAYVFLGGPGGLSSSPATTLSGVGSGDLFGWSVAGAGDVNGDGYSDVVVGAWDVGVFRGAAYVFLGAGSGLSSSPATSLSGIHGIEDRFGWSVASAGDVNGDGYSDIIVGAFGAPVAGSSNGEAYIYLGSGSGIPGSPSYTLSGLNSGDEFGYCVSSAGDVNGDGYSDVIIGAPGASSNAGTAAIYLGGAGGMSGSTVLNGISTNDQFGLRVACAGDINGDGYSDVIAGAPARATATGAFYVYQGSATGISSTPSITQNGYSGSSAFGYVASAGDVNGDGYSDIVVGAPNSTSNTGAVYIYHGSANSLMTTAAWTVESNQAGAEMGFHISGIASAGDVNGDGYSDVIIGLPYYDNGQTDEGMVYVYYGSANGLPATPSWTAEGNQASAYFGVCVASAGDVNGDGYSDIIIGAHGYDNGQTDEGRAFVYYGSASGLPVSANWTAESNQAGANFGFSVASAGDVNGDGYSDVIIGALYYDNTVTDEGAAFVYYGSGSGLAASPGWAAYGGQATCLFSHSVASAGDVNGDGYSDVIVGAHYFDDGETDEGKVFLYYGSAGGLSATPNWTAEGNLASAGFGVKVASAGDVNGDGYGDVIIGAHNYSSNGKVFVYYGSSTGLPATANWTAQDTGPYYGIVSSAGDVNGDGYSDVLVGAFGYSNGESNEGRAYVYLGSATGLGATAAWTVESNTVSAYMGYSVACAGDVNGDGFSDILVGAPFYTNGESSEGKVFLYYGNATGGLRNNLRLYNTDLVTPIQRSNILVPDLFGAGLYARSPLGRVKGKLVWEVKGQGNAFSGNPITNSTGYLDKQPSFTDLGVSGNELKSNVQKLSFQNKIRARAEYSKATAITGQIYGPWRYPAGYTQGAYGMNSLPLPLSMISFTGQFMNTDDVQLQWITTHESNMQSFIVERSADGLNFTGIGEIPATGTGSNRSAYSFTDRHVSSRLLYYRLQLKQQNGVAGYSKTITVNSYLNIPDLIAPNPVQQGSSFILTVSSGIDGNVVSIHIYNSAGQLVAVNHAILHTGINSILLTTGHLARGIHMVNIEGTGIKAHYELIIR